MKNINWRFILINLLAGGLLVWTLLRNNKLGGFYKIALGILLPITIYGIVHYLVLRKMLNMPFPFEPLRKKHLERIKIARKISNWTYKDQEWPNWAKHNYAGTPYVFAFAIAILSWLVLVLGGLAINAYTPFDLKTIFDPRSIPKAQSIFGYFIFLVGWYTLVLTSMLLWFSQAIFDKPRSAAKKAIILAGLAAFAAVALYIIMMFQIASTETLEAIAKTL